VFGFVGESIYSDEAKMAVGNIDLRARSFIGTPQTLGVYAAVLSFFTYSTKYLSVRTKFTFIVLFLLLGLLSGSKSFYLTLAITIFVFSLCTKVRIKYFTVLLLVPIFLFFFQDVSGIFKRIYGVLIYLDVGISNHATYIAWVKVLDYDMDTLSFLFGNGVGALSRASQEFYVSAFPFSTSESYILQMFFEIGLVGIIVILCSMLYLVIATFKTRNYANFAIIFGIFANMIISPSFYGVAFSFFGYYFFFRSQYNSFEYR
jgi:hypothetical protein